MTNRELETILKNEQFYIFGTGFVSEMLWRGIEQKGLEANVLGFLVSDPERKAVFHGRPVLGLTDTNAEEGTKIIVAVHETVYRDIDLGNKNVIWIYPYLYGFLYGNHTEEKLMTLNEIRNNQPGGQYWIAARYAAIEGIEKGDAYLKNLYTRAMMIHSSKDTAEKRLVSFERILMNVRESGFDTSKAIDITDRFEVIDGLHRLAMAAYFNIEQINCRVYRHSDIYDKVLGPANRLPERILRENSFTEEDIAVLKAFKEICG